MITATMQRMQQRYHHRSIVIPTMTTFSNIDKSPKLSPLPNTRTTTIMQVYRRKSRKRRTESRKREIKSLLFDNSNQQHHHHHQLQYHQQQLQSSLFHNNNHNHNFHKRECEKNKFFGMREWENERKKESDIVCVVIIGVVGYSMIFYQTGCEWGQLDASFLQGEDQWFTQMKSCSLHVNEFWTFWPKMVIYNYPTDDNGQTSNKFWTCALFRSGGTQQRKFPGAHTSSDTKKCAASLDVWHLWTFKGFVVKRSSLQQ